MVEESVVLCMLGAMPNNQNFTTSLQIPCTADWKARVKRVASSRMIPVSALVRGLVDDGLEDVEDFINMSADPGFMAVMQSIFSNAEVMGSMMQVVAAKQIDDSQMQLFGEGMKAFQKVVAKAKKPRKKAVKG